MQPINYTAAYFDRLTAGWNEASFPLIAPLARRAMAVRPAQRILDYGCGSGTYAGLLAEGGAKVDGCDISEDSRAVCATRYDRFLLIQGAQDLASGAYDVVFSTEVLEHIQDHHETLRHLYRALVPGGVLCLTTTAYAPSLFTMLYVRKWRGLRRVQAVRGFCGWLAGWLSPARADAFVQHWGFEVLGGHYHGFHHGALRRDFRRAGFDILEAGVFYAVEPIQLRFLHTHTLRQLATRSDWPWWKRLAALPVYCVGQPANRLAQRLGLFANNLYLIARKP